MTFFSLGPLPLTRFSTLTVKNCVLSYCSDNTEHGYKKHHFHQSKSDMYLIQSCKLCILVVLYW